MDNREIVENLAHEYQELQDKLARMREEVRKEYREIIRSEINSRREELERVFAIKFETARKLGVKRYELEMPVLKTKDGNKYRHFVELGGGALTKLSTVEERIAKTRAEELEARQNLLNRLGWIERHDGLFMDGNGLVFKIRKLENRRLYAFPEDESRWEEAHAIRKTYKEELAELYTGEE